jgi:putative CocE/NonD family hydrolase
MGAEVTVAEDVPARMRDGTVLRADVYRPAVGGPFPTLLTRTPYGKGAREEAKASYRALAAEGYLVAVQDVRGRFASEGEYRPYHADVADGYDTVLWAAGLEGASGRVGMFGTSYLGQTQWLAASGRPPPLRAIMPVLAGPNAYEGRKYYGGAFQLGDWLPWTVRQAVDTADRRGVEAPELRRIAEGMGEETLRRMAAGPEAAANPRSETLELLLPWLRHLPLPTLPALEGLAPYYYEWLSHPVFDEYWQAWQNERRFRLLDLPAYNVGGWYDVRLRGNLIGFTGLRARARTPEARRAQKLLVGPWAHGALMTSRAGVVDFGPEAALDLLPLQKRWFDHWLKGIDTGLLEEPPVRIFVMGANVWRQEGEWPLARTCYVSYYFHSGGLANTLNGDGTLSPEPPIEEPPDHYFYDPQDPVPSLGGKTLPSGIPPGAFDQREVEARADVLCYTSAPLPRDLEVTGPLGVTLYAASSAPDTDWVARLVDVHPDGFAQNLQEGILRASHRISSLAPSRIRPGEVYEYSIDLWATSNVFPAGHRIRVEISSSNFPHWDRNPNTGDPDTPADHVRTARQTVLHDGGHPSHILLPIIE